MAIYDKLEKATSKAFDTLANVPGYENSRDADVKFYETLTPQAFDAIAATYGPEALTEYIQAMEVRRMKNAQ